MFFSFASFFYNWRFPLDVFIRYFIFETIILSPCSLAIQYWLIDRNVWFCDGRRWEEKFISKGALKKNEKKKKHIDMSNCPLLDRSSSSSSSSMLSKFQEAIRLLFAYFSFFFDFFLSSSLLEYFISLIEQKQTLAIAPDIINVCRRRKQWKKRKCPNEKKLDIKKRR